MIKKGPVVHKRRLKRKGEQETHVMSDRTHVQNDSEDGKTDDDLELSSVLRRIVDQIDDADRSNSDTLKDMQNRLAVLCEQTNKVKSKDKNVDPKTISRIRSQLDSLSERIEIISQGRVIDGTRGNLEDRIEELAQKVSDSENENLPDNKDETAPGEETHSETSDNFDDEAYITFTVTEEIERQIDLEASTEEAAEDFLQKLETVEPFTLDDTQDVLEAKLDEQDDTNPTQEVELEKLQSEAAQLTVENTQKDSASKPKARQKKRKKQKILSDIVAQQADATPIAPEKLASLVEHFSPIIDKDPVQNENAQKENVEKKPAQKASTNSKRKPGDTKAKTKQNGVKTTHSNHTPQSTEALEKRFALIAAKLEETLDQRSAEFEERIEISNKFDDIAFKLEELLNQKNQYTSLQLIEEKLDGLTSHIQRVESNASRIDKLEVQLLRLIDLVTASRDSETVTTQHIEDVTSRLLKEKSDEITENVTQHVQKAIHQFQAETNFETLHTSMDELRSLQNASEEQKSNDLQDLNKNLQRIYDQIDELGSQVQDSKNCSDLKKKHVTDVTDLKTDDLQTADLKDDTPNESHFSKQISSHIDAIQDDADINSYDESTSAIEETDDISSSLEDQNTTSSLAPDLTEDNDVEERHFVNKDNVPDADTDTPAETKTDVTADITIETIKTDSQEDFIAAARRAALAATKTQKLLLPDPHISKKNSSDHQDGPYLDYDDEKQGKFLPFSAASTSSLLIVIFIAAIALSAVILITGLSNKTSLVTEKEQNIQSSSIDGAEKIENLGHELEANTRNVSEDNGSPIILNLPSDGDQANDSAQDLAQPAEQSPKVVELDVPKNRDIEVQERSTPQDLQGEHFTKDHKNSSDRKDIAKDLPPSISNNFSDIPPYPSHIALQVPQKQSAIANKQKTENILQPLHDHASKENTQKDKTPGSNQPSTAKDAARSQSSNQAVSPNIEKQTGSSEIVTAQVHAHETKSKSDISHKVSQDAGLELPSAQIGPFSLRSAAVNGDPKAQFTVGMRYLEGKGIVRNYKHAVQWLKRSASQGYALAQYHLAALYERGTGVPKDIGKAKTWYHRAADSGNIKAMHNLGVFYTGKSDDRRNYAAASLWFLQAANRGLADSQYNLGILYKNGLGIERNLVEAYKWFALATFSGDRQAEKQRNNLKKKMSKQEIRLAQNAIENWQKTNAKSNTVVTSLANAAEKKRAQKTEVSLKSSTPLTLKAQILLKQLGFDVGIPDGHFGPRTNKAILAFQKQQGLPETGKITQNLLDKLIAAAS